MTESSRVPDVFKPAESVPYTVHGQSAQSGEYGYQGTDGRTRMNKLKCVLLFATLPHESRHSPKIPAGRRDRFWFAAKRQEERAGAFQFPQLP